MSTTLQHILSFILVYRYTALFIVSFLSSLGIPLPAAASAVAAAAFASQGYLNFFWLIVVGAAGNILGDIAMYWLMRRYGKKLLVRVGLRRLAESRILQDVEHTVTTYEAPLLIASRFQDQATLFVNIISGLGRLDFKRFALFASIGDILQIVLYVSIGTVFSNNWQDVYNVVGRFSWVLAIAIVTVVVVVTVRAFREVLKPKV